MSTRLPFFNNCVNWSPSDVTTEGGLSDMISEARDITRRTFLKHVDREERIRIELDLGYALRGKDLTMARDWHVSYSRSKLHGRRVYFFTHSAIEYVFAETKN